jgi:hypothetical protein
MCLSCVVVAKHPYSWIIESVLNLDRSNYTNMKRKRKKNKKSKQTPYLDWKPKLHTKTGVKQNQTKKQTRMKHKICKNQLFKLINKKRPREVVSYSNWS